MALKFSLQNVLDVRHSKVESLEIDLSKLLMTQLNIESRLSTLEGLKIDLMGQLAECFNGDLDLFAVNHLRSDIETTEMLIKNTKAELEAVQAKVDAKRQELVSARQAEETLNILKRNRNDIYNAEQAQIEARAQDDIYIAQAYHQRRQEG